MLQIHIWIHLDICLFVDFCLARYKICWSGPDLDSARSEHCGSNALPTHILLLLLT